MDDFWGRFDEVTTYQSDTSLYFLVRLEFTLDRRERPSHRCTEFRLWRSLSCFLWPERLRRRLAFHQTRLGNKRKRRHEPKATMSSWLAYTNWIWLSIPKGATALFFFFKLIFVSRIVPLLTDSVSALLSAELWVASLSRDDRRFKVPSGLWLNDRRNTVAESLFTRKKGPGSDELSRSSALRLKLDDLTAGAAVKVAPALMLRLMASLMCFTMSRFSSAVL